LEGKWFPLFSIAFIPLTIREDEMDMGRAQKENFCIVLAHDIFYSKKERRVASPFNWVFSRNGFPGYILHQIMICEFLFHFYLVST